MKKIIILICLLSSPVAIFAQADSLGLKKIAIGKNRFEKKFLLGGVFTNAWTDITGLDSIDPFIKPSLGLYLKAEFNINTWLGFSVAAGHQQRGTGVISPDYVKELGNPDSTFRFRLRTNTINVPLMLFIRTPKDVCKNFRVSFGAGISPSYVYNAKSIFHSLEDGFHNKQVITDYFDKLDFPLRANLGFDFNAAESVLFRVNLFADYGMKPVYRQQLNGDFQGRNRMFGIDMDFLF
ncbi:MAG: outer membrane beta-barrel protein [Bacteroidota bacterium]